MKYDMSTDKAMIINLLMKKMCTFNDIKLMQNTSKTRTAESLRELERDNIVHTIWKHEILTKGKCHTRVKRIYILPTKNKKLISESLVFNTIKCVNESKQKMLGGKNIVTKK